MKQLLDGILLSGTGRFKWRHLLILVTPVVGTVIIALIWGIFRSLGLFVPWADAEITTNSFLPTLGAIYAITAAVILHRVIEEDVRIHQFVEAKDIDSLKKELKKRIHPLLHILMSLLTIFLIAGFALLPYESLWSGVKDVGGITFCLLLYWKVALVLDNPFESPWIRDVIPSTMRAQLEASEK